ncbi:peptide ABC transporter substrate-binding protein [Candidatus Uhrbacteria bacterium]|nr:peptide ABC transporter substrate-binding protein [Candidatus Uhrbacteria bacterium]
MDRKLVQRMSDKRLPSAAQLKHLPRYLSPKEKTVLRALGAVAVISAAAIGLKFAGAHLTRVPATGGEYAEAVVGAPRTINPVMSVSNDVDLDIGKLVYSGLMRTNGKGELIPDLAASYETSADGKTTTFRLRDGIEWHDGHPFTSKDVVTTIDRIKDPQTKSPWAAQFKNVSAAAPDDHAIVFTLNEPFAPFLSTLTVGVLPDHLWSDILPENTGRAELNTKPVGTGPFKFKSFTKDKKGAIRSYSLSRNDRFYGERPHLETVTFKFSTDFSTAVNALLEKQVDGLSFLPLEFRDTVEKRRSVKMHTLQLPQYTAVFFNQRKNPLLSSKDIRKALALVIDREAMVRTALEGNAVAAYGPILPGYLGFDSDIKAAGPDLAAAAQLLDKEGWKLDEDGMRRKAPPTVAGSKSKKPVEPPPKQELKITLTTVDTKENIAVAQMIEKSWESIGVQTELQIVPSSKIHKDHLRPREYEALLYGEILGPDPDPYPFWHSSQNHETGLNLALYSNRKVDELLEKARTSLKSEERAALYGEFQKTVIDDLPAIFLYSPNFTYVVSRGVKGVEEARIFTPADRFAEISKWYMKTKQAWR